MGEEEPFPIDALQDNHVSTACGNDRLKYRHYNIYAALQDAHRAIRFVRSKVFAIEYFCKLKQLGVPAELHIYEKGFHGFGLGTPDCQCGNWIDLFRNWLVVNKLIGR